MTTKSVGAIAVIFLIIGCLFSTTLVAQQNSIPTTLDFKSALEIAQQNYPSIKAKIAEQETSLFELRAMKNNYLPNLIVQGQVMDATSNQVRGTFFPNEGTAIPVSGGIKVNGYTNDAVWTSFATALVNWKFFSFGKFKASVDEATARLTVSEADYQNELFQHKVKVSDAYILTLMMDNMVKSQQANLERVKALKSVTVAYALSGLRPGVDSSLVNAEYSKATLLFLEANRLASEQYVYLKELLGLQGEGEVRLDTTVFLKRLPSAITTEKNFNNNPRLALFKNRVAFEQLRIKSFKRRELPSISLLAAGWGRGSGISDKLRDNGDFVYSTSINSGVPFRAYNYMVGISTIWNVTSLFKTSNEAKRQTAVVKVAQENYNEESLKIESEWERARFRYGAALEVARQTPIQLKAALDAYSQAKARYDAGFSTILELTQTFAVLNRAEVDSSLAMGNVWRAILQYAATTGDFDIFINNLN